jgi:hypothetical protein
MKKNERDFIDALDVYFEARNRLDEICKVIKHGDLSQDSVTRLASKVASFYECHWYLTSEGGVTFCDDLQNVKQTRRDDARKFWRRTILGKPQ